MKNLNYFLDLEIPNGVQVSVNRSLITVNGPKGEISRDLNNPRIVFSVENNKFFIRSRKDVKFSSSDKMFMNTYLAHIKNMVKGVRKSFNAKLKVCSGHFPMQVTVAGDSLQIKNFLGEKVPRKTNIIDGVKVTIQGDTIILEGIDKEKVGQTAAKIEQATRITNRDRRIFQDGIYIIQKPDEGDQ